MKCWCIINLADLGEFFGEQWARVAYLRPTGRPHRFYENRGEAMVDQFRLQTRHPDGRFVLFEAVAEVRPSAAVPGAWHLEQIDR